MGIDVAKIAVTGSAFGLGVTLLVVPPAVAAPTVDAAAVEATQLMASAPARVGPDDSFEVTAELTLASDASGLSGETVNLQWQRLGTPGWLDGGDAVTGGMGVATWQVDAVSESRRYRIVYDGSTSFGAATSEPVKVGLRPAITASASRDWVRPDGSVTIRARMRPAFDGEALTLQRRSEGRWRDLRSRRADADGRVEFLVGGRSVFGSARYRIVTDAVVEHVAASSAVVTIDTVRLVTYVIETRGNVQSALPSFVRRTAEIYADPRGWSRAGVHFKRVQSGGAFSLVLSQARYVPGFAPICDRYWSCRVGRYVVINEDRWRKGTPYFKASGGTLRDYRAMVVNHETGHWFGLGHATCGGAGRPAPVMMQQSKGLYGCQPNPWPLAWEIALAY